MSLPRLLIVDDEAEILELIRLIFSQHEVSTAHDAPSALALLASASYDILITDVRMPGASGLDLLDQARKLQPGIHAIVITGHQYEEQNYPGVARWILKPFRAAALREAVQAATELSLSKR